MTIIILSFYADIKTINSWFNHSMSFKGEQLSVYIKCTLGTGKLALQGLPRNSKIRLSEQTDMTSAVYCQFKVLYCFTSLSNSVACYLSF